MATAIGMLVFGFLLVIVLVPLDLLVFRFIRRRAIGVCVAICLPPLLTAYFMASIADSVASNDPGPMTWQEIAGFSLPLTAFVAVLSTITAFLLERATRKSP
jgi:phosphatidylglycerophosphatase A